MSDPVWLTLTNFGVGNLEWSNNAYTIARSSSTWVILGEGGFSLIEHCCKKMDPVLRDDLFACWNCLADITVSGIGERWGYATHDIVEKILADSEGLDPLTAAVRASELLSDMEQWLRLKGYEKYAVTLGKLAR